MIEILTSLKLVMRKRPKLKAHLALFLFYYLFFVLFYAVVFMFAKGIVKTKTRLVNISSMTFRDINIYSESKV